ncbi:MAG: peroxidase family protein [Planctomycetota bacterium]|nr:peroxidase family protein [Planctomycetota bacterium]
MAALLGAGVSAGTLLPAQDGRPDQERSPVQRARPGNGPPAVEGAGGPPGGGQAGPGQHQGPNSQAATFPFEFRTIDGAGNNTKHPDWGATEAVFQRLVPADYGDGAHAPAGAERPSPRAISNGVVAQDRSIPNAHGASDYLWMWGQFLDHDLTETPVATPSEALDIEVPLGDAWFDPAGTGLVTIPLDRSSYDVVQGVRQQVNLITAFLDASNVYGSEEDRAHELRTLDGTGRLKTSEGDLLPYNLNGYPNAMSTDASFFLAGDIRANEQVALTAMHTLFVREHNFWAERIATLGIDDGELTYELARAVVAAEMQAITYREFLPVLLGKGALPPYQGYNSKVDASIANEFATAGYRVGHTMLSPQLLRVQADGSTHPAGDLTLASAFFHPEELSSVGIDPYLRGLGKQLAQRVDPFVIDEVRNFLFGPPGAGGFDLASLNIQRGRDHGLPGYNDLRDALGHPRAQSFQDVSTDLEVQARLALAYDDVDDIDAWVGLLSEDHAQGAVVGKTLRTILVDQFRRLRDGDRFWYRAYLSQGISELVEKQTLATIIRRNTDIGQELQDDVFHVR